MDVFKAKHITIGIAGHVDHGKTSLVRCLTGIDTDRLREEKRRGLSIESGIAPLALPTVKGLALVDVPGHTDFLKNTIRGLSSVDAAVLVVASDDGVMPQTREHLEILRFFGAETGLAVLSKADMVDEETLELAELELREILEGTFLQDRPIIPFSATNQRGLDEIRSELETLTGLLRGKDPAAPFRLWIDQVKTFPGFGTVVSGTVFSGMLRENDPVQILPVGLETRVRSLQSHHDKVPEVWAGQRAGVNLHKIPAGNVNRGMLLADPHALSPGYLLNVDLRLLSEGKGTLKNRQKVRLYLGTAAVNAMVVLMEREALDPGQEGLAQLRLARPLGVVPGDPFVLCPLNVSTILGGGKVLEVPREKYRSVKAVRILPSLMALQEGDLKGFLDHFLSVEGNELISPGMLRSSTGLSLTEIQKALDTRVSRGELLRFGGRGFFPRTRFQELKAKVPETISGLFAENPLKPAVTPEEVRKRLVPSLDETVFERMVSELLKEGKILKKGGGYQVPDFSARLSDEREKLIEMLLAYARETDLVPFHADTFWKLHRRQYNKNEIQRLLDYLQNQGRLVCLNNRRFMTAEAMERIKGRVKAVIQKNGCLTIGNCKEVLGYGRTVGVPVFEYLDSMGFTRRDGDKRTLI